MSEVCACGVTAVRFQNRWLCGRHYRFRQMRVTAKRHGKAVPTPEQLEALCPRDMRCQDCGAAMQWLAVEGYSTVITLQHYRDGTLGLVCMMCNLKHAKMPGDSYRAWPKDQRKCPRCTQIKSLPEFYTERRGNRTRLTSWCKVCQAEAGTRRYHAKKDAIRALNERKIS